MQGARGKLSEELNTLKNIESKITDLLKWTKFAGAKEVRGILTATLDSEQKRLIYHLNDGKRGSVEIAKAANTSDRTVRRYWESWARQGIVESLKVQGGERYRKSFELEDFGIEVPVLQAEKEKSDQNTRSD
jgi:hypothetical protein